MSYLDYLKVGGFNFDNHFRNKVLTDKKMIPAPKTTKTGTTIVGLIYKDGVVIAADTRATGGTIVMDKNVQKIHYLAPNMYCCGAGTAADCDFMTNIMSSELELMRLNTNRIESRISTAVTKFCTKLHRYQGHIGAALIIGGVDVTGPNLVMISPYGNCSYLPYTTMGSGSLAAMSIFEAGYKDDMSLNEARDLAIKAIEAGIIHDEGSGSNVDVCVITRVSGVVKCTMDRGVKMENKRLYFKPGGYSFPAGVTKTLGEFNIKFHDRIDIEEMGPQESTKMMEEKA